MEIKEIVGISISSLALVLSITATIISLIRSRYEKQRIIRSELSDTLSQIISGTLENAKLYRDASNDPVYYQTVSSILNQQNAFLLNEAIYLIDQIPDLVTTIEYNTIAAANANSGQIIVAENYYLKAIAIAASNYHKALATRSYANFIFAQRRFEEGREQFRKSIALLKGGDNIVRLQNGLTYQIWAWNERNNAQSEGRPEELFESARTEFNGIDNEVAKQDAVKGLEATIKNLQPPPHMPS